MCSQHTTCTPVIRHINSIQNQLPTGWTVRWSNPGGGEIFRTHQDQPWSPRSLLYKGSRVPFPGAKRPCVSTTHPQLASRFKKNSYISAPPLSVHGRSWGKPFTFTDFFKVHFITNFLCTPRASDYLNKTVWISRLSHPTHPTRFHHCNNTWRMPRKYTPWDLETGGKNSTKMDVTYGVIIELDSSGSE